MKFEFLARDHNKSLELPSIKRLNLHFYNNCEVKLNFWIVLLRRGGVSFIVWAKALNQCKIIKLLYCCSLAIKMYYFEENNISVAVQISVFLNISFKTTYTMGNKIELWLCHKLLFSFESVKGLLLRKNHTVPSLQLSYLTYVKRMQGNKEQEKSETENYYNRIIFIIVCMKKVVYVVALRETEMPDSYIVRVIMT